MYSITMSGNYIIGACVNDFALHMVDVSNPDAPIDLKINSTAGTLFSAVVAANNYLYAESQLTWPGFTVFSISGTNLVMAAQNASVLSDGGYGDKMILSGNQIYTAAGMIGLQIINVASPYSPSLLGSFSDSAVYGAYWSVAATGNALCASDYKNFKVFDLSQPSLPLVANVSGINAGQKVVAQNGIAYVEAGDGMRLYSVATPSSPQLKSTIANSVVYPYDMQVVGITLYVRGYTA